MPFEISQEPGPVCARLTGTVSAQDLEGLVRELHRLEDERGPFHRITDLSGMTAAEVAYPEVNALADRRRTRPMAAPVRSAIVANRPLQIGYARMFQTLNDNTSIEIRLFATMDEALRWVADPLACDTDKRP